MIDENDLTWSLNKKTDRDDKDTFIKKHQTSCGGLLVRVKRKSENQCKVSIHELENIFVTFSSRSCLCDKSKTVEFLEEYVTYIEKQVLVKTCL